MYMFTNVKVYFSANNGEEIMVLPIVPATLPELVQEFGNQEFETNEFDLTLIGKKKRRTASMEFLLPVNKNYRSINSEASADGRDYIDFFEKWTDKKVPLRLVVTEGNDTLINIAFTFTSYKWNYDKKKDIICSIELAEYIFTTEVEDPMKKYNWMYVMVKCYGGGYKIKAANVNGHWLIAERKLLELMGYTVSWNAEEKAIYINGEYKVKTEHKIMESVTYCYLYQLCEELGFTAEYDKSSNTVTLQKKWNWTEITVMKGNTGTEIWASNDLGHYIVQAKPLLELMGYKVSWNTNEKAIYLDGGIKLKSKIILVNGASYVYLYQVCNELNFTSEYDGNKHWIYLEEHTWTEITVRYNYKGYEVWASNIEGHWLGQVGPVLYTMGIEYKEEDGIYYVEEQPIKTKVYKKNDGYYCYIYQLCDEFGFTTKWDDTRNYMLLSKEE